MKKRSSRLVGTVAALLVVLAGGVYLAGKFGKSPVVAVAQGEGSSVERLRERLEGAWERDLAALGKDVSAEQRAAAARAFSDLHAAELAERDRRLAAEGSAPYAEEVRAMSQKIAAKAGEYAEVRRKLHSGELADLSGDLAPPPLPAPLPAPSAP